jgi:hypothetical protein
MKSMTKLMLVMMELIILVILKVHANDPTTPSSAPTILPTGLHLFELDNVEKRYIEKCCIQDTFQKCKLKEPFCTAEHLLECLFKSPMHFKDFPIEVGDMALDCFKYCYKKLKLRGYRHARCIVSCYNKEMKKHI